MNWRYVVRQVCLTIAPFSYTTSNKVVFSEYLIAQQFQLRLLIIIYGNKYHSLVREQLLGNAQSFRHE